MSLDRCAAGALVSFVLALAACGGAPYGGETIPRTQAGVVVHGPPVSPSSYEAFVRAERAAALGAWPEAASEYRLALAGAVEDPLVLARLAVALAHVGRADGAAEALAHGDATFPGSEAVALGRGEVAVLAGDTQAAAAAFARAAELAPASARGPLALADVLVAAGDPARAIDVLARFAGTAEQGGVTVARARLHVALVRAEPRGVADAVRALLAVAPARRDELVQAADAVLETDPELAFRLVAVLPARPDDVGLRVRAAIATGRTGEAEALLRTRPPEDFGGVLAAAQLLLDAGAAGPALALAEGAIADGGGPAAESVAGAAALALHDDAAAAAHYARVPPGAHDEGAARSGLALALEAQGLPGLAAELRARAR